MDTDKFRIDFISFFRLTFISYFSKYKRRKSNEEVKRTHINSCTATPVKLVKAAPGTGLREAREPLR